MKGSFPGILYGHTGIRAYGHTGIRAYGHTGTPAVFASLLAKTDIGVIGDVEKRARAA
jgi:hypothetical protein